MNTITHGLAPLLLTYALLPESKQLTGKQLVVVGLCGALPDLINPHLSLAARMASWSHGLPAWLAVTVLLLVASAILKSVFPWRAAVAGSLAYLLHLFCDAIAGGINWLSPVGDAYWGAYWFPVILWVPTDVVLVLTTYLVFRAIPQIRKVKQKTSSLQGGT